MRKSGARGRNLRPLKTTKDGAASFVIIQTLERLSQPPGFPNLSPSRRKSSLPLPRKWGGGAGIEPPSSGWLPDVSPRTLPPRCTFRSPTLSSLTIRIPVLDEILNLLARAYFPTDFVLPMYYFDLVTKTEQNQSPIHLCNLACGLRTLEFPYTKCVLILKMRLS